MAPAHHPIDPTRTARGAVLIAVSAALVLAVAAPSLGAAAEPDVVPDSILAAHARMGAEGAPTHPCLDRGTLLLSGGGIGDAAAARRFRDLSGGAGGRLVIVPTAGVDPADPASARAIGERIARRLGVASVTVLHAASRLEADASGFAGPLRDATGVWISSGDGARLVDTYMGTRAETALIAFLAGGGVVAGSAAGAMVWGSEVLMYRTHPGAEGFEIRRPEDLIHGELRGTTFGLLRRTVLAAHFTRYDVGPSLVRAVGGAPSLLGIGLDDESAVEVHDGVLTVLGRGRVHVFDARHPGEAPLILKPGALYDLRRRVEF
jgi:cyanophycinase